MISAQNLRLVYSSVLSGFLLTACGGSTDDGAGSPEVFSVAPSTKTLSTPGACGSGYVGDFLIVGGTAPYRLVLSDPDVVSLSTSLVTNRNGIFSVTFYTPTCLDPSSVTIIDALGHVTTLTLKNVSS